MKIDDLIRELNEARELYGNITVAWKGGTGYIFGDFQFGTQVEVVKHEQDVDYNGPELPMVFLIKSDYKALWEQVGDGGVTGPVPF